MQDIPLAGGYSDIVVCVTNPVTAPFYFVTAAPGSQPGDLCALIEDEQGMTIGRGDFDGYLDGARFLADGTAYSRLEPEQTICADVSVLVPAGLSADSEVAIEGIVATISRDLTEEPQRVSGPLSGLANSTVALTDYYGTAQADKDAYASD